MQSSIEQKSKIGDKLPALQGWIALIPSRLSCYSVGECIMELHSCPYKEKNGSSVKNGKEPKHKAHKGVQREEDTFRRVFSFVDFVFLCVSKGFPVQNG
jgi:hypothetical protein